MIDADQFKTITGKMSTAKLRYLSAEIKQAIISDTAFLPEAASIGFRIQLISDHVTSIPICPVCRKREVGILQNRKFNLTCSRECSVKHTDRITAIKQNTDYDARTSKTKATNLERYGSACPANTPTTKARTQARHGVQNISQLGAVKDKKAATRSAWSLTQAQQNVTEQRLSRASDTNWEWFTDPISFASVVAELKWVEDIATHYDVGLTCIYKALHRSGLTDNLYGRNKSKVESLIIDFCRSIEPDVVVGSRSFIPPRELDIVLPSCGLAIEVNGLFWHKLGGRITKTYHLEKSTAAQDAGLKLLHFTDVEVRENFDLVKSMISVRTGHSARIHARKLEVREVSAADYRAFTNRAHISGYAPASIRLGLYQNEMLTMIASFSKDRFSKSPRWELIRLCSELNTTVVGGAAKLIHHFHKKVGPTPLLSYCDRRYGDGGVYKQLGFKQCGITPPGYHYFSLSDYRLRSRQQFQKHKLSNILDVFNPELSEADNMAANGYFRYYDCGHIRFVKEM